MIKLKCALEEQSYYLLDDELNEVAKVVWPSELDIQALRLKTDNELIHALLTSDDDLLRMLGKRMAYIARYGAGRHEVTAIEAQPRP